MIRSQVRSDEDVLTDAHTDFQKGLHEHAFFKVSNRHASEDLVQDTYAKAWGYMVGGGKVLGMKSFLYHTLNNLIIDYYRKKKSSSLDVLLEKGFDPGADPSEVLFDAIDGRTAQLLIMKLPQAYQKSMRLRYVHDCTLKEISERTKQSRSTVAVQLHRGLERIKVLYGPVYQ